MAEEHPDADATRAAALTAHRELYRLLQLRERRVQRVRQAMDDNGTTSAADRAAVDNQFDELQQALAVTEGRIRRLEPAQEPSSGEPLRVLLAGGGSGGHIYPLIAVARELERRPGGAVVRFVGERGRMEEELVPREGLRLSLLRLPSHHAPPWRKALAAPGWLLGYAAARELIAAFAPQIVVGTGGQVCVPVLFAAHRTGLPTVVIAPDAVPGKAIRLIARHAPPDLVANQIPLARRYLPETLRIEELGYPIRPAFLSCDRETGAAELGLDPAKTTVVVFGGSLGSGKLNSALLELLPRLTAAWASDLQVLHVGGYVNARTLDDETVSKLQVRYVYRAYLHQMELALACADLVVGRAGAASLAELTALGLPALLVPLPGVSDDHQRYNAAWMVDAGAAVAIPDAELTADRLEQELAALLADPGRLAAMAAASRGLAHPDAAAAVVDRMMVLCGREASCPSSD